jgi:RimJ/RimL family protein N-acetyltransferase
MTMNAMAIALAPLNPAPARPQPLLTSRRLHLRPPCQADVPAVAAALGDHAVAAQMARVPQPYDRQEASEWLAALADGRPPGWHFAVEPRSDSGLASDPAGTMIGYVRLEERAEGPNLAYWLAQAYWRRGVMSEAVHAVLAHHFSVRPGTPVTSGVFADNPASLRLQERLGFVVTGRSEIFSTGRNAMATSIDTRIDSGSFAAQARRRGDNL